MKPVSLQQINAFDHAMFVQTLGDIYEYSPWVAQRAYAQRPFATRKQLHQAMLAQVKSATVEEQTRLILSHPELAGREAQQNRLGGASKHEQAAAGLDQCSAEELDTLQALNQYYRQKFGFPFIIAVKGLSRHDIMQAIEQRLQNSREQEFATCLEQIGRIADFRLQQLIIDA